MIEVKCPDCQKSGQGLQALVTGVQELIGAEPKCETCDGYKKVLVDRKNLVKLTGVAN